MLQPSLITMLAFLFIVAVAADSAAKEWRGIVPLRSTREDVVSTFHHCENSNPNCEFEFKDEFVHIEFSGDAKSELYECSGKLHPDTVLLVEMYPHRPGTLKQFGLNKRDLRAFEISRETKGYIDERRGLVLKMYKKRILQLDYIAAVEDRSLCPSYYENPEMFVEEIFQSHVPVLYLSCPTQQPRSGDPLTFSADLAGDPRISFLWTVTEGKIFAGQGTRVIKVDTTGLDGKVIVATVRLSRVQSSCEVKMAPR